MFDGAEQVQRTTGSRQELMSLRCEMLVSRFEFFSWMAAKMCVEFGECIEQGLDIFVSAMVDDIDIDGHHRRPLEDGRQSTDEHEIDITVEKDAQNLAKISLNRSAPSSVGRR